MKMLFEYSLSDENIISYINPQGQNNQYLVIILNN